MYIKKTYLISTALFSLLVSACVSRQDAAFPFDRHQAAKSRVELALAYMQHQDYVQARINLDKALQYAPEDYLVHSAFAYYHQQQGETELAEQAYLNAIGKNNKRGDVLNNYGAFLCRQGKFATAYQRFEQALNTPGYYQRADTYENIALCALSEQNSERYRQSLLELEKLEPARAEKLKLLVSDRGIRKNGTANK
ncbi:type IV pilus assembly protein PilF [Mesocricetibacter intestinalis]|uniref:Type IV pilus assembly protein PilF n=1 Tax=Mesocricetibacter intestinalis TaxID=1521930 RepID=A0A4R6VC89_9PAST|nr:type IV pilus biogenesis/stability protein PilW [Mesocricetibacter intestinalis]TDQ59514.1 type IV pilus assembly protein PilF [Mesocricetibacter intestinalis]